MFPGIGGRCCGHRSVARWRRGSVYPPRESAPCGPAPHRPALRFQFRRRRRGRSGNVACGDPGNLGLPGTVIPQNLDPSNSHQPGQDPSPARETDRTLRGHRGDGAVGSRRGARFRTRRATRRLVRPGTGPGSMRTTTGISTSRRPGAPTSSRWRRTVRCASN